LIWINGWRASGDIRERAGCQSVNGSNGVFRMTARHAHPLSPKSARMSVCGLRRGGTACWPGTSAPRFRPVATSGLHRLKPGRERGLHPSLQQSRRGKTIAARYLCCCVEALCDWLGLIPSIATLRASAASPVGRYDRNVGYIAMQEFQRRCRKTMHAKHADNSEMNDLSGRRGARQRHAAR
jgi:hypothetical protein